MAKDKGPIDFGHTKEEIDAAIKKQQQIFDNSIPGFQQYEDEFITNQDRLRDPRQIEARQFIAKQYNQSPRMAHKLISYFGTAYAGKTPFANNEMADPVVDAITSSPFLTKSGDIKFDGGVMWSGMRSSHTGSPYSRNSFSSQDVLQNFERFTGKLNKKNGHSSFVSLDIETLGDFEGDDFHVTEIAMSGKKIKNGQWVTADDLTYQALIKPKNHDNLLSTIQQVQRNPEMFKRLNANQQRTLIDLIRYSGIGDGAASFAAGVVLNQNSIIDSLPLRSGKNYDFGYIQNNIGMLSQHMQDGLNNLVNYGHDAEAVKAAFMSEMERHNKRGRFVLTKNGTAFDLPGIQKFFGEGTVVPTNHLDWYHVQQAIYPTATAMRDRLAVNDEARTAPFIKGGFSLEDDRVTAGIVDNGVKHTGIVDTDALNSVAINTYEKMYEDFVQAAVEQGVPQSIGTNRGFGLSYNTTPLSVNNTLFAPNGVMNYSGALDFQGEYIDGKFVKKDGRVVLNAETFYRPIGVKKVNHEGKGMFALELLNEADNESTFIVRENRAQMQEFLQKNLEVADFMSSEDRNAIYQSRIEDKARRRYQSLFGLKTGATKGFDAAERMFANVAIWRENKDLDRTALEGMMNFNSSWDPTNKSWKFNKIEAQEFWAMLGRLDSEYDTFVPAIGQIKEAFQDTGSRSQALANFASSIDSEIGRHTEVRDTLPHEMHSVTVKDRFSGKLNREFSINFSSADRAMQRMFSYIYADNDKFEGNANAQEQRAKERVMALATEFQEKGLFGDGFERDGGRGAMLSFVNRTHEQNLAASASARELVMEVFNNQELLRSQMELESVGKRQAMAQINASTAEGMITGAINQVTYTRGQFHTTPVSSGGSTRYMRTVQFSKELEDIFAKIDQVHELSGLKPNNRGATEGLVNTIMNRLNSSYKDPRFGVEISTDGDNRNVFIDVFETKNGASVREALIKGKTHANSSRITLPLIGSDGIISYGNMNVNAATDLVFLDGKFQAISSVEKISHNLQNSIGGFAGALMSGDTVRAQDIVNGAVQEEVTSLAGRKLNMSYGDSMMVQNNPGDLIKQGTTNVESAIIHDLANMNSQYVKDTGMFLRTKGEVQETNGVVTKLAPHFKPSAFENGEMTLDNLRWNVGMDDLTSEGQELIRKNLGRWGLDYAVDGDGNKLRLAVSGVKGDRYVEAKLNQLDVRDLYPYGAYSVQGRDNAIQGFNVHTLSEDSVKNLQALGVVTDDLTTTDALEKLKNSRLGGRTLDFHLQTAYMTEADIRERMEAMRGTEAGKNLLMNEGIMDAEGNWVHDRMASIYEQQAMMDKNIRDAIKGNGQKFYVNPDDLFEYNPAFLDDGKLREGARVNPGDILGWNHVGNERQAVYYNEKTAGQLIFDQNSGRTGVHYERDIHKYVFDIEKTTSGSGFSRNFLEALTGVEGVQAIINSNIDKHNDVGSLLRGQVNRILNFINQLDDERQRAAGHAIMQSAENLGIQIRDGKAFINAQGDIPYASVEGLFQSLNDAGIHVSERQAITDTTYGLAGRNTTVLLQAVRAADVDNYSKVADGTRREVLGLDPSGRPIYAEGEGVNGVRYGTRELDILRRQGLNAFYDEVVDLMKSDAVKTGRYGELVGMSQSIGALTGSFDTSGAETIHFSEFNNMPQVDRSLANHVGTILDSDSIKQRIGTESPYHGFMLELPETVEIGAREVYDKKVKGKVVQPGVRTNQIFIPLVDVHGQGNEVWKTNMQRMIADIHQRSAAVEEARASGVGRTFDTAVEKLQVAANNFFSQIREDLTSSHGMFGESVSKVSMPNSMSGLLKITSPFDSVDMADDVTYISHTDAKKMGVFDTLKAYEAEGKDFFATNVRYPSFHTDAIVTSKLRLSENVEEGSLKITSWLAKLLRGDSDGDYNNVVAPVNEKVQTELAERYAWQQRNRDSLIEAADRKDGAWANAKESAVRDFVRGLSDEEAQSLQRFGIDEEVGRDYTIGSYAKDGMIQSHDPRDFLLSNPERAMKLVQNDAGAKSGKALVGWASNLNLQMRQLSQQYLQGYDNYQNAIETFGARLEQKIISAKHGGAGGINLEARTGAFAFLDAIQRGNWTEAIDINANQLALDGGEDFAKHGLLEAAEAMQRLQRTLPEAQYRTGSLGFGTSGGVTDYRASLQELDNMLGQVDQNSLMTNTHMNVLHELLSGAEREGVGEFYLPDVDSPKINLESLNHLPNIQSMVSSEYRGTAYVPYDQFVRPQDANNAPTGYLERGLAKTGEGMMDFFRSAGGKATLIGAGVAAVGLGLVNAVRGNHIRPEEMPHHEDNELQGYETTGLATQRTARIEGNGSGLNGLRVNVRGSAPGHLSNEDIGNLAGSGLNSAGIPANVTINSNDNTSEINQEWLQGQFAQLLGGGYVN